MGPFGFSAVAAALLICGCGSEEDRPDLSPPAVVETEPADGAVGVPRDAIIRVWFDEAVDNTRIDRWGDHLHLVLDGSNLYGNGSYDLEQHVATLALAFDLAPGETYQAVIEHGVCDMAGNCTTEPDTWSFTAEEQ